MILSVGCGDSAVRESTMPPAEFTEKLEKERPELFIEKTGKNTTGVMGGREKRAIIRREYEKAQQGTQ
jgi:hypothetical protein